MDFSVRYGSKGLHDIRANNPVFLFTNLTAIAAARGTVLPVRLRVLSAKEPSWSAWTCVPETSSCNSHPVKCIGKGFPLAGPLPAKSALRLSPTGKCASLYPQTLVEWTPVSATTVRNRSAFPFRIIGVPLTAS
jgi:hypothetical protein